MSPADNDDRNRRGPWGSRPDDSSRPSSSSRPADIETVLRGAQERFGGSFRKPGGGSAGFRFGPLFIALLALWGLSGLYRVLPEENAVILTFGKWTSTRGESGLGYSLPWPIQTVMKVNVAFDRRLEVGFRDATATRARSGGADLASESQMLTGDENIVAIDFVVMWRIHDARSYLFNIRDPETTVRKVAESAMREIVGREKIQRALTEGRADIEARAKELMQKMLDDYQSGITLSTVQLLRVDPPEPVVDAFDDVQRARADKERIKNEAETYRNDILPRARGEAQKLIRDAEAYRDAALAKAKGEAERFIDVYEAYARAKDVTAKRLYIETMQDILKNTKKVISGDQKAPPVLPYMPLNLPPAAPKP